MKIRSTTTAAFVAALVFCGAAGAAVKKPNIVLIISDDQSWTDYGFMGHPAIKTPQLDKLSKLTAYEGGIRTPIMFRWPGKIKQAERPELCSSIDIVPTILAAAGADIPKRLPGLNLLANLQDEKPIERNMLFGESFDHNIADIENPEASLLNRWVIRGDYKLLLTYDGIAGSKYGRWARAKDPRPQLFNLMTDPHEKNNLAATKPELVKELGELIRGWYPLKKRRVNALPIPKQTPNPRARSSA